MTAHFIAEQLRRVRGGFIAKGGQLPGSSAQAALKPPCGDARQTGGGQHNVGIHRVAAAFPISGNASNLISNYEKMDDPTRKQTFLDIYDDSMWLINLVENILSISRIEDGRMNLSISTELVSEVFEEALRHTNRHSGQHTITVQMDDDLLLAHMDAKLVVQVLINLVDNAIKYTPAGSHIVLSAAAQGESAVIRVSDDGPGIPDEAKEKVFEMFSTGEKRISDSRRSLGLGLALCRTIIAAHGGTITLSDNTPHGCIFTFTLPLGEVSLHE